MQLERNSSESQTEPFNARKIPSWVLPVAAAIMLIVGPFDAILFKWVNNQVTSPCEGCPLRQFEAPCFQVFINYVGGSKLWPYICDCAFVRDLAFHSYACLVEALLFFAYKVDKHYSNKKGKSPRLSLPQTPGSSRKKKCPMWKWAVNAFLEALAAYLINFAFVLARASTVQLLRNFDLVLVALFTVLYLKIALRIHQLQGVFLVTTGLICTAVAAMMRPEKNNYQDLNWLGIALTILVTMLNSSLCAWEENTFRHSTSDPIEAIGLKGLFGLFYCFVALIIFEFTGIERTSETFYMMTLNNSAAKVIIFFTSVYLFTSCLFNSATIYVTKVASGLLRMILNSARTIAVWIAELIIGWSVLTFLDAFGLGLVLIGVLICNYNYLVKQKSSACCDIFLRKPILCCGAIDPNSIEEQLTKTEELSDLEGGGTSPNKLIPILKT